MKIALLGYGKMGRAVESIAIKRGHTIVSKIDLMKKMTLVMQMLLLISVLQYRLFKTSKKLLTIKFLL